MPTIEIDFEVFKALTAQRATESVTYNDVIRGMLGLGAAPPANGGNGAGRRPSDWLCKGVRFPNGTEFRASYRGVIHYGKVEQGKLVVKGKVATSPSDAARIVTGNSVNGWTFWECRFPGESRWRSLQGLRSSI